MATASVSATISEWLSRLPCDYREAQPKLERFEHFHLGGSAVLGWLEDSNLAYLTWLDLGSGVGGNARFLASKLSASAVDCFDIDESLNAANDQLNRHFGVNVHTHRRDLSKPSGLPESDAALVSHIGLFIGQEAFSRLVRSLVVETLVIIEPVARGSYGYPQMWADSQSHDRLMTAASIEQSIEAAGFRISDKRNLTPQVVDWFRTMKPVAAGELSLADCLGWPDFRDRTSNGRRAITVGSLEVLGWVCSRPLAG